MVIARRLLVREGAPGCYHVMSRCVRRLHCLADEERRAWVESCFRKHTRYMAIDVLTFAVMKNHVHLVLRIRPDIAEQWSAEEVVDRWLSLVPPRDGYGQLVPLSAVGDVWKQRCVDDFQWVAERRLRLSSMSWLMRLTKQKIARRMNVADEVTGCFWDERFLSIALPDERSVLACMMYVDLNPFRAGECELPENGQFTGLQVRLRNKRCYSRLTGLDVSKVVVDERTYGSSGVDFLFDADDRKRQWVIPIYGCGGNFGYSVSTNGWLYELPHICKEETYLNLLDEVARESRGEKKAILKKTVMNILDRLDL